VIELPEIVVSIIETHHVFGLAGITRPFSITTSISGAKSALAAIYDRADIIIAALRNAIPLSMVDLETVSFATTFDTPQLDAMHHERLSRRPLIPNRHL